MLEFKEIILIRIEELVKLTNEVYSKGQQKITRNEDAYFKAIYGTISLLKTTYGDSSSAEKTLLTLKDKYLGSTESFRGGPFHDTVVNLKAILENLKLEIGHGLLASIENRTAGEIYGDLVSMSRQLFDEGEKEASSILASGALEDSMKSLIAQLNERLHKTSLRSFQITTTL